MADEVPPLSAAAQAALESRPQINLDDIFGDCFFTPEGETVFLNDTSESERNTVPSVEQQPTSIASKLDPSKGNFVPVPVNAPPLGNTTTGSTLKGIGFTPSGGSVSQQPPRIPAAQPMHHMNFVSRVDDKKRTISSGVITSLGGSSGRMNERKMSEQQKVERRYVFSIL